MSTYTPKGETVDLKDVATELAINRLARRAAKKSNERYDRKLDADPDYKAFLAGAEKAKRSAEKFRLISESFYRKAIGYSKRLENGETVINLDGETIDYTTEMGIALENSQFYRDLSEAEDAKTVIPQPISKIMAKLWFDSFNAAAGELGYNLDGKIEKEKRGVLGDIEADIQTILDAAERREVVQSNNAYLSGVSASAQDLLRTLFGEEEIYAGETNVSHVDGRLEHRTPVTIYTLNADLTVSRLPQELILPDGNKLALLSSGPIPLKDGSGTTLIEAHYAGSKRLHK